MNAPGMREHHRYEYDEEVNDMTTNKQSRLSRFFTVRWLFEGR